MIKINLFIFLLVFLTSCATIRNDVMIENLNGKIVKLYQTKYEPIQSDDRFELGEKSSSINFLLFFDDRGNLIETHELSKKDKLIRRYIQKYINGNIREEIGYDEDNLFLEKTISVLTKGKIIRYHYNNTYSRSQTEIYEKINRSNGIRNFYNKEKLISSKKEEFKKGLLRTETIYNENEEVEAKIDIEYNSNKDMVKKTRYYPKTDERNIEEWEYQYDNNKNWIKRLEKLNQKVICISVREITYKK